MHNSKLSDHKKEKGLLVTPFNSVMSFYPDSKSWVYGRLPEYLWLGLILKKYGRNDGFEIIGYIIKKLHEINSDTYTPKFSNVLTLSNDKQNEFFAYISTFITRDILSPLTLIYNLSNYPIFSNYFFLENQTIKERTDELEDTMRSIMNHQTNAATDIRYMIIYSQLLSKRLYIQKKQADLLYQYQFLEHDNELMRMIRPMIRSIEMMSPEVEEVNEDYLNYFWEKVSVMNDCKLNFFEFEQEQNDINTFISNIHQSLEYLREVYIHDNPLDMKMQVLLGISTYAFIQFKEINDHNLYNTIVGRYSLRALIENYIIMKYMLHIENEHNTIWKDYQLYGLGSYKKILLKLREGNYDETFHVDIHLLEALVNEFVTEESINIDLRYFDNVNIRTKSEKVDEKELYDFFYDYDTQFEHGLWGAIRESAMLKCDNPLHRYHCVPDIDGETKLKSIQKDCISIFKKIIILLDEVYRIPSDLLKEINEYDECIGE